MWLKVCSRIAWDEIYLLICFSSMECYAAVSLSSWWVSLPSSMFIDHMKRLKATMVGVFTPGKLANAANLP
jgi:hypothetical protein